jgi:hypothetical protein
VRWRERAAYLEQSGDPTKLPSNWTPPSKRDWGQE